MKIRHIAYSWMVSALLAGCFMAGCQQLDADSEMGNPRLFKPGNLRAYANYNGLIVRWDRSPGATGYQVDIARNEAFEPVVASQTVIPDSLVARFENLEEETRYFVRMRGLSDKGEEFGSQWVYFNGIDATTGLMPSIFKAVRLKDMTYTSVTLRWKEALEADQLVVSSEYAEDVIQPVTPEIMASLTTMVEGLEEGREYRASFLNAGNVVSYVRFTIPARPAGAIEIDNTGDLKSTIENAPEGATVILKGGQLYDYSNAEILLTKSVTVQAAPGADNPVIAIKQFVLGGRDAADVNIPSITFSDVDLTGAKVSGGSLQPSLEPNDHIFMFDNMKNAPRQIAIGKFTVKNCSVHTVRKAVMFVNSWSFHLESKIRFDEIVFDNDIVYDLGRRVDNIQAFLHLNTSTNNTDVHCAKYTFSNSTFYHVSTGLIEQRMGKFNGPTPTPPQVQVTNCTLDKFAVDVPGAWYGNNSSARYLFHFTGWNKATVRIDKSLLGEVKFDPKDSYLLKYNALDGATLSSWSNSYLSSGALAKDLSTTITNLNMSPDELFPGRADADYRLNPAAVVGTAGDPRWTLEE